MGNGGFEDFRLTGAELLLFFGAVVATLTIVMLVFWLCGLEHGALPASAGSVAAVLLLIGIAGKLME